MLPRELFQDGRLTEALRAQIEVVRSHPEDIDARYLLFVLFCFSGELERAASALNALAARAKHLEVETVLLRSLLAAESERRQVLTRSGVPLTAAHPPAHVGARLRALAAARMGDLDLLEKALDEAAEATPRLHGRIGDMDLDAARDDDDLLGSVLEVFSGGRYLWLPLEEIRALTLSAPRNPFDLLWAPAQLEMRDGTNASLYVPVLYQGSHADSDDAVRLGRSTVWNDIGRGIHRGAGQRVLRTLSAGEAREWPLLEIRGWVATGMPDA